jgi:hypothetical protein
MGERDAFGRTGGPEVSAAKHLLHESGTPKKIRIIGPFRLHLGDWGVL